MQHAMSHLQDGTNVFAIDDDGQTEVLGPLPQQVFGAWTCEAALSSWASPEAMSQGP